MTSTIRIRYVYTLMSEYCVIDSYITFYLSNRPSPFHLKIICPLVLHLEILKVATFVMMTIKSDDKIDFIMINRKIFKDIFKELPHNEW